MVGFNMLRQLLQGPQVGRSTQQQVDFSTFEASTSPQKNGGQQFYSTTRHFIKEKAKQMGDYKDGKPEWFGMTSRQRDVPFQQNSLPIRTSIPFLLVSSNNYRAQPYWRTRENSPCSNGRYRGNA